MNRQSDVPAAQEMPVPVEKSRYRKITGRTDRCIDWSGKGNRWYSNCFQKDMADHNWKAIYYSYKCKLWQCSNQKYDTKSQRRKGKTGSRLQQLPVTMRQNKWIRYANVLNYTENRFRPWSMPWGWQAIFPVMWSSCLVTPRTTRLQKRMWKSMNDKTINFQTIAVDFDGTLCYSQWPENAKA